MLIEQNGWTDSIQAGICQPPVHQKNQQLCAKILERVCQNFPSSYTPKQRAHYLSAHLDDLAFMLLNQGIDLNAYSYQTYGNTPYLQFSMMTLWEGKQTQPEIPLTLFIYVWPPEKLAQEVAKNQNCRENDPRKNFYASNIHGHPLSCALTVLKGTICQENYQAVKGWPFNVAQKIDEEILKSGSLAVDDNSTPFIHRLLCRDESQEPAYTLHGYGASSTQEVHHIFKTTKELYSYPYVLKENGELIHQEW
jgi:hypothetical protein